MNESRLRRLLSPVVSFQEGEALTGFMMFVYSFLAMAAYNNIKPSAASEFIDSLGADNAPWVFLAGGISIGFILNYYSKAVAKVPKLWVLPGTQLGLVLLLLVFWVLFQSEREWVSIAFFFFGRQLLGIFLISQFWTLANEIYNPRQAKRIFGFIGGGAMLGGMTGSGLTALYVTELGTRNLLLVSCGILAVSFLLVLAIQKRTKPAAEGSFQAKTDTVGGGEALSMFRNSRHLQIIALIIGFGALGATTLETQYYMVLDAQIEAKDIVTSYIAGITFISSLAGLVIQMVFTSRVYSMLGIGFALAVLPVNLGAMGILVLLNGSLWASALARASDTSLRYSLDKTTRETLFLPLPTEFKLKAKGFVDVVADRFIGKGIGSAILLVAIKLLGAQWWHLSILAVIYFALWLPLTRLAKREYMSVFRRSIDTMELEPERLTPSAGDMVTVEALVEELGSPDETHVLRSIELLESLDKHNLITPLLMSHPSPRVRARALKVVKQSKPDRIERWLPAVEQSLKDDDMDVRAAAVDALASVRSGDSQELMLAYLHDGDPRIVATAATALSSAENDADRKEARSMLERLASDKREAAVAGRREAARAIAWSKDPAVRHLLVPLMEDADLSVAQEAIKSARKLGDSDTDLLYVPNLISLLRDRRLKNVARDVLVSYGENVVPTLAYFVRDDNEDLWVRRHIPGTLARIPSEASLAALLTCLESEDGFIRFKSIAAIEKIRRERPHVAIAEDPVRKLLRVEMVRFYRYLSLGYNLFDKGDLPRTSLLGQAIEEKLGRSMDRIYSLLGLVYDMDDIRAARYGVEKGDVRSRSSAIEFLDNTLSGELRKMFLPMIDDIPLEEKVRKGNVFLKTRVRGVEDTLTRLLYDEDPVIAATAIDLVRERKMWELASDLEEVLQFRDPNDFAVFESASYALAAYRLKTDEPYAI
jgi:AAA family ATP:ADP antiporter